MVSSKSKTGQAKPTSHLQTGLQALKKGDYAAALTHLQKAVEQDQTNPLAWRMLAFTFEQEGDFVKAFTAYEFAARLAPDDISLLRNVGHLAYRLEQPELAIKLFTQFLVSEPDDEDVINALAQAQRDLNRYGDAVDLLRNALSRHPERAGLWNILGTVLNESGDPSGSLIFFDEALRLAPNFHHARHNRANALNLLGEHDRAIADFDIAAKGLSNPNDIIQVLLGKAFTQLLSGDLVGGFETYEARFNETTEGRVLFQEYGRRWQVSDDLSGKSLLVYGEQGLGDEVMFANILKDVDAALGADGRLFLAVEPRLVALFQRSFPRAVVLPCEAQRTYESNSRQVDLGEHAAQIDLWAPMGSLFRRFRRQLSDFPTRKSFLVADPERVAYWRQQLEAKGPGPYVGILWKSGMMQGSRQRYYSPFDLWGPLLENPDAQFVNLQYGDAAADLADAKARAFDIWSPPGIDLKMDIDDLAALCRAVDLVVGPSTATTNIAPAVGTKTWIIASPGWWTRFGSDHAPCYPVAKVFDAPGFNQWEEVMQDVGQALKALVCENAAAQAS